MRRPRPWWRTAVLPLLPLLGAALAGPVRAEGCDVAHERCTRQAQGVTFSLALEPPVKGLTPFTATLEMTRIEPPPEKVTVAFSMLDMDMGLNRYRLAAGEGKLWSGQVILPICTTGRSDWLATAQAWRAGKVVAEAAFPFTLGR